MISAPRYRARRSWTWVILALLPLVGVADISSAAMPDDEPELAALQSLSRAFNRVARLAQPGVVSLRVQGGDRGGVMRREAENFLRELLEERLPGDELETLLRDFRQQDSSAERLKLLNERLERVLEPATRQMLYWRLRQMEQYPPGSGSGFLIDDAGHILTNYHVVERRTSIVVLLADGRELDASIVGTDRETDLALLKVEGTGLTPLKIGDSDRLEVGDWVIAVGAPFGLNQTVTHGIVSALGRKQVRGLDITYQNFIQTDASVNPGNSGGPLLNLRGEVVGVNTAIASPGTGVNAGIAFTIPSNMALRVARQLKLSGTVERGYLGVQPQELVPGDADVFGLAGNRGVWIDVVTSDSPAAQADLRVEDVVVSVNGVEVRDLAHFFELVADLAPGEPAELGIIRNRAPQTLKVQVGRRAEMQTVQRDRIENLALPLPELGMYGYSMRPGINQLFGREQRGVVIAQANSQRSKGLRRQDLVIECDGTPVRTVYELQQALAAAAGRRDQVQLRVLEPSGDQRIVTVPLR